MIDSLGKWQSRRFRKEIYDVLAGSSSIRVDAELK